MGRLSFLRLWADVARTVTSVVTLAVGSIAVASAVLLILDLSTPYSGIFRASHAPLEQALAVMGKE